jgi:hypothetical protein
MSSYRVTSKVCKLVHHTSTGIPEVVGDGIYFTSINNTHIFYKIIP